MSNTKIEDSIISAVEILTDRAISQAGFDKTIQGTIKRCENKAAGQYVIKYQDSTFYAYSTSPDITYGNNTLVYVLVPQGDFKNNKTILGAVKKLGKDYITMLDDNESYEVIGQNLFLSNETFALKSYDNEPCVIDIDKESNLISVKEYEGYIKESNYLQIKAKVRTKISNDQDEGKYYLNIRMKFIDKAGQEVERSYRLGTSQIVGNPYSLSAPTTQSVIYPIDGANFVEIVSIELGKEGFKQDAELAVDDIWFSNIEINAVEPLVFAGDGKLSLGIITTAGRVINEGVPNQLSLEATLKSKGAVYSSNAEYMWFVEDGRTATGDGYSLYAGYGWKRLDAASNILYVPATDIVARDVRYRCIAIVDGIVLSKIVTLRNLSCNYRLEINSSNGTDFFLDNGEFSLSTKLYDNDVLSEKSYDTYWYSMDSHGIYASETELNDIKVNTIEGFKKYFAVAYINDTMVASAEVTIRNSAQGGGYSLIIRNSDKVYKYDEKGISPTSESRQNPMRIPALSFEVYNPDGKMCFDSESSINGCKITWLVPAEDSLIEPDDKNAEIKDGNYIFDTGILKYKISNYYRATRTRKQIQLIVNYNGNILSASTNFTFTKEGGNGTNGTSYTVVIHEDERIDKRVKLSFKLYQDGELMSEMASDANWSILTLNKNDIIDLNLQSNGSSAIVTWDGINLNSCDIIKLECKAPDGNYIYSYYPIRRYERQDIEIEGGPGEILFNNDLTSCEYDDDPFEVKNLDDFGDDVEVVWGIRPVDNNLKPIGLLNFGDNNIGKTFMPRIKREYDGSTNNSVICRIVRVDSNGDYDIDNYIAQKKIPIYIGVNRYSNSALNGWDGSSIQIDAQGDQYILAPQIGAGVKNSDNSFTGIVMGTQKKTSDNTSKTGLFAYNKGAETVFVNAETGDVEITGKITAISGEIGSWVIDSDINGGFLKNQDKTIWLHPKGVSTQVNGVTSDFVFYSKGKFGVDTSGGVYFTEGKVGPWILNATGLTNGEAWVEPNKISCGKAGGTLIAMIGDTGKDGYLWVTSSNKNKDGMRIYHDRIEHNGTDILSGKITVGDVRLQLQKYFGNPESGQNVQWKRGSWDND